MQRFLSQLFNGKLSKLHCFLLGDGETYTSVMALDYKKLQVQATTLAKALCEFLAHVARKHAQYNKTDRIASVAHSLGGNQGRSIIPAYSYVGTLPSERAPS